MCDFEFLILAEHQFPVYQAGGSLWESQEAGLVTAPQGNKAEVGLRFRFPHQNPKALRAWLDSPTGLQRSPKDALVSQC